jgi:hypothetical protein
MANGRRALDVQRVQTGFMTTVAIASVTLAVSERAGRSGFHHIDHGVSGIRSLRRRACLETGRPLNVGRDRTDAMVADRLGTEQNQSDLVGPRSVNRA